jgi:Fe2+ or Zn2+ uptake regulation protein
MTPQRRVILDELSRLHGHPTAREVFRRARRRLPRVSLGTVYRNLELFSQRGLIRTVELSASERRYDAEIYHHDHVRCIRCGRIENAPIEHLDGLEEELAERSGYEIVGHRLEFEGICPACRSARQE